MFLKAQCCFVALHYAPLYKTVLVNAKMFQMTNQIKELTKSVISVRKCVNVFKL